MRFRRYGKVGAAEQKRPVIDDDPHFRELVTVMLTKTGFGMLPAEGPSRIELAQAAQPGIATCKEPKRDRVLGDIPRLGVAASSELMCALQAFDAERRGDGRNTNPLVGGRFPNLPLGVREVWFTTKCPTENLPLCHLGQPLLGVLFENKGSMTAKSPEISSSCSLRREFWHDSWSPSSGRSRAQRGSGAFESLFHNPRCREVLLQEVLLW